MMSRPHVVLLLLRKLGKDSLAEMTAGITLLHDPSIYIYLEHDILLMVQGTHGLVNNDHYPASFHSSLVCRHGRVSFHEPLHSHL